MDNNHLFAVQSLRFTLEHILSEYILECARAKPRKGQLDRQEAVFKKVFQSMVKDLVETRQIGRFTYGETPYLDGVLMDMNTRHESAEFAIDRFVLSHRYPTK